MNCPKCDGKTQPLDFEADLQVERCEGCKGVWMDKGELARYANLPQDLPAEAYASGTVTTLICPSCSQKKLTHELYQTSLAEDLTLDFCKTCQGLWFDHKELSGLTNHLKQLRIKAKLERISKS